MLHSFADQLSESWQSFRFYLKREKALRWFVGLAIIFLYGIRLIHEDVFIDSDIMMTDPDSLEISWYGHRRFGLILTRNFFFLSRLLPWHQNVLFVFTMWLLVLSFLFCIRQWSREAAGYGAGSFLFAAAFLSAPCFAEQFLFVLQAFESSAAMLLCILAAYCSGRWIYDKKSILWTLPALFFMIWAFGSYQAYPAFYIALVVISFITVYLHGEEVCGLKEGLLHILLFILGFLLSQICADIMCRLHNASSSYVNHMFCWGKESLDTCLSNLLIDYRRIYMGEWSIFFTRWFRHLAAGASVLALYHGLNRRSGKFPCFLFAVAFLVLTPILITLITGMPQPVRSQMTYPLVLAYYLMLLYEGLKSFPVKGRVSRTLRQVACFLVIALGLVFGWKKGLIMGQLWETAHESYVSDKLTANRMYSDICHAANRSDPGSCTVAFVGIRKSHIAGTPAYGDVIGHSFFEWDSAAAIGSSGRINTFFKTLGLFMEMPDEADYQKAVELSKGKPDWPAPGSVFVTDDGMVIVKLSDINEK